jgi:hypothetical protein
MFPLGVLSQRQKSYNPNLCFGLYHFDGGTGSTIFSDQSPANRNLTGDGAITWDTAKFGDSSVLFPDDIYDKAVVHSCYDVGNSDFTFELFFLFNFAFGQVFKGLIANADDSSAKDWQLYLNGQKIEFGINLQNDGWQTIQHQNNALSNAWNYVKVLRKNGVIKIGLNGVESSSSINVGNQSVSYLANKFVVGGMYYSSPYNGLYPYGFIDELRLNKQAIDGWSVPTAPFSS